MRIKTTRNTLQLLPDVTKALEFSSNAETLKLALNYGLYNYPSPKQLENLSYDGFEIDTHILFGEDLEYYYYLLKQYYGVDEIEPAHICTILEQGFVLLNAALRKCKYDPAKLMKLLLED